MRTVTAINEAHTDKRRGDNFSFSLCALLCTHPNFPGLKNMQKVNGTRFNIREHGQREEITTYMNMTVEATKGCSDNNRPRDECT